MLTADRRFLETPARHIHQLFAVETEDRGCVNIYEVQMLLGHSDVRTTEIYSHLTASELQGAVDKIIADGSVPTKRSP